MLALQMAAQIAEAAAGGNDGGSSGKGDAGGVMTNNPS